MEISNYKEKKIYVASSASLFLISCLLIVLLSYHLDAYPQNLAPTTFFHIMWLSLLLTFLNMIVSICVLAFCRKRKCSKRVIWIPIVIGLGWIVLVLVYLKQYNAADASSRFDYIKNESCFYELGLTTLKKYMVESSDSTYLVYIGRTDCSACDEFEREIKDVLDRKNAEILTYYTDNDRNGSKSKEMYALLHRFHVTSVPAVILCKDGATVKLWLDPEKSMEEISRYVKLIE